MKHLILFSILVVFVLTTLMGCSSAPASSPIPPTNPPPTNPPPATNTPSAIPTTVGKVKIYYEENAQVELISPEGSRVLIDVYNRSALSSDPTAQDVLLTTHTHSDHYNADFVKTFPGQQLFTKVGSIKIPGVAIQGIAAGHNSNDTPKPENGTDYIYVIDMGGLRIAHCGDLGQDALTADQLATLGKVDIAIEQFDNSFSAMNVSNKKGFNLAQQIQARLIIPTHNSPDAVKLEGETWKTLYSESKFVSIGRNDLTNETRILYLGNKAKTYGNATNATKVDW